MQSAKESHSYRFDHYEISITPFNEKKLQINVVDKVQRMQFHEKLLILNNIGRGTLMKALQKSISQVKLTIKVNKTKQNAILQINVFVSSLFLKPVEQMIYIKKCRDISQSQILKTSIASLSSKVKNLKENDKTNTVLCQTRVQQKSFAGAGHETISQLYLPKGKYMFTLSFLVKATNSWMYIYFQQGQQQLIQNCGFYVPNGTHYFPVVVRKIYEVKLDNEKTTFTTSSASSYPIKLRNIILSAQKIN